MRLRIKSKLMNGASGLLRVSCVSNPRSAGTRWCGTGRVTVLAIRVAGQLQPPDVTPTALQLPWLPRVLPARRCGLYYVPLLFLLSSVGQDLLAFCVRHPEVGCCRAALACRVLTAAPLCIHQCVAFYCGLPLARLLALRCPHSLADNALASEPGSGSILSAPHLPFSRARPALLPASGPRMHARLFYNPDLRLPPCAGWLGHSALLPVRRGGPALHLCHHQALWLPGQHAGHHHPQVLQHPAVRCVEEAAKRGFVIEARLSGQPPHEQRLCAVAPSPATDRSSLPRLACSDVERQPAAAAAVGRGCAGVWRAAGVLLDKEPAGAARQARSRPESAVTQRGTARAAAHRTSLRNPHIYFIYEAFRIRTSTCCAPLFKVPLPGCCGVPTGKASSMRRRPSVDWTQRPHVVLDPARSSAAHAAALSSD